MATSLPPSAPAVVNDTPDTDEYGTVVRPIGDVGVAALNNLANGQVTVGIAAVQLDATPLADRKGISIKAHPSNTGTIYVGADATVTTATGYPLAASQAVDLDLSDAHGVWAIADQAAQVAAILEIAGP